MSKSRIWTRIACVSAAWALAATAQAATLAENQKFVAKLYQDLLGRTPNRTELTLYSNTLSCCASRAQVAGAITSSNEYRSELIQGYYSKYLNRTAMAGEVSFYSSMFQMGATDDDVQAALLGGDEFYQAAGGTVYGFVGKLFVDVLGRSADRISAASLENMLKHGTPRQTVAGVLLHSLEADQREVSELYEKFLHRAALPAEVANYAQMLQWGAKDEMMADLICGGDEYFQASIA